ncbi:methyl-accepting chemotaxis protein, putative [Rhodospirillum centenum SW]|uniref:Methyl-accepting chemotaxis protein, putative n=1 Tax=Rhodospirillum centenum (strain ATCC 51521 / SW) TaxID=414684 RepID=B6ISB9_RHOCS|nr:methyl-accepting chemotaxis protein, putative [Rhodospirillum centenum SW]
MTDAALTASGAFTFGPLSRSDAAPRRAILAKLSLVGLLANVQIGTRIALLVIIALLTVLLTAGLFVVGDARMQNATERMAAFNAFAEASAGLERQAMELQLVTQGFLRARDAGLAESLRTTLAQVHASVERMRALPAAGGSRETLDAIGARLQGVGSAFETVLATMRSIGFTDQDGLRARMLASVAQADQELRKWPPTLAAELFIFLAEMRNAEKSFLISEDESFLGLHRRAFNQFDFQLPVSQLDEATKKDLGAQVRAYRTDLVTLGETVARLKTEATALTAALGELRPLFDALFAFTRDGTAAAKAAELSIREQTRAATLAVGGVLLLLFLGLSLLLLRSITRPLAQIEAAMRTLAKGERLSVIPGIGRRDEIGAMARAIDVFRRNAEEVDRLKAEDMRRERVRKQAFETRLSDLAAALEQEVAATVEAVLAEAADIARLAEGMEDAARRTGEQSRVVAGAAQDATGNVQTVAAATEQLAASSREIGRQVGAVADMVTKAVQRGAETQRIVGRLAEAARNIGQATDLISSIAGQTNLLALNATIEAARAGEAGKGFAVVAGEVKSLAGQTGKATEEISGQITAVQSATAQVIEDMDSLHEVIRRIDGIAGIISASVGEQGSATESISASAASAAGGTIEVSDRIQAVAEDAGQTGRLARDLAARASQVTARVQQLRERLAGILDGSRQAV